MRINDIIIDRTLHVERNLTSLSELLNSLDTRVLKNIYCTFNSLKTIDKLPDSLELLYCHHNLITSITNLPNGLTKLICHNNKLNYLPELPETLETLECEFNPLKCLIPSKFLHLQYSSWMARYYYPYINSYEGQKTILTNRPGDISELIIQAKICPEIREEFDYLFINRELNLI